MPNQDEPPLPLLTHRVELAKAIMERAIEQIESLGVLVKLRGWIIRPDKLKYERAVGREERRLGR